MTKKTEDGNEITVDEDVESPGCGWFGRNPLQALLIFATLGLGVGVGLSFWRPETEDEQWTKDIIVRWLGLLGDIFIRALKCLVIPLVFFNIILATVEMLSMGKASSIGWKTIGAYFLTTGFASVFGAISTIIWSRFYTSEDLPVVGPPLIQLGCNAVGSFLVESLDGSVSCTSNILSSENADFVINDLSGTFATTASATSTTLSLSETFYQGVFYKVISSNIVESFATGDLLAVVFFACIFGVALGNMAMKQKRTTLLSVVEECDMVLIQMILWVILLTPFAVFSLIAGRLAKDENLANSLANVGFLFAATLTGMVMHSIAVHFVLFSVLTKNNPFTFLSHLIPAMTMAFACSSSVATLPVTSQCVEKSGKVSKSVANFVLPLGSTINMDGTAIYIPAACVWLAAVNGMTPNPAQYFILIILGTVGSAGAAPVPSASLVLIITAYNTVFNQTGTPAGFSFILAIDWLVDSFRTVLNVTGDAVVSAIISASAEGMESKEEPPTLDHRALEISTTGTGIDPEDDKFISH